MIYEDFIKLTPWERRQFLYREAQKLLTNRASIDLNDVFRRVPALYDNSDAVVVTQADRERENKMICHACCLNLDILDTKIQFSSVRALFKFVTQYVNLDLELQYGIEIERARERLFKLMITDRVEED